MTAAADQQTSPGIITQGSYQSTFTSDDVREGFQHHLEETIVGGLGDRNVKSEIGVDCVLYVARIGHAGEGRGNAIQIFGSQNRKNAAAALHR